MQESQIEEHAYFKDLSEQVLARYKLISEVKDINVPVAKDVASRVEGLLSVLNPKLLKSGLAEFIRGAEKKYAPNDIRVALDSSLEVARSKFIKFASAHDAIEMGIRVGLAYITLGVVSAPLEGFIKIELKKRADGGEYISCFFGGPIRGAGGTAAASVVLLADSLRVEFNLGKYDPTEEEIKRIKVEVTDYNDFEARLQYFPNQTELDFLMRNLPIEIEGDPTTDRDVSAYKNTPRINTTKIRGGMCLVLCEGFAQKAAKLNKQIKSFGKVYNIEEDFKFINEYLKIKEVEHAAATKASDNGAKVLPNYRYLEELAAGRPVFSYPLRSGGFRLRYGRSRTSGLAAASLNPATCYLLGSFIATGSQLRVELPGKACAVTPCSTIDGPIVKLKDNSVIVLHNIKEAEEYSQSVSEILYLGDILFNYGDFAEQGHLLMPSPFVSEWWDRIVEGKGELAKKAAGALVGFEDFVKFSRTYGIPLHPKFLYLWTQVSYDDLYGLVEYVFSNGRVSIQEQLDGGGSKMLALPFNAEVKRTMEKLGIEHKLKTDIIVENADALLFTVGFEHMSFDSVIAVFAREKKNTDILSQICGLEIRDTAGTFIGARLGRPEKAKMREMETNPSVIFPIGESGGLTRNIITAAEKGTAFAEYAFFHCGKCNRDTIYKICEVCGSKTEPLFSCRVCGIRTREKTHHGKPTSAKMRTYIKMSEYLNEAYKRIGIENKPGMIKGVKGVFNNSGEIEFLEKGIIRSLYGLNVNKDGTIRFDGIEVPITHFKPLEVGTSIERLRSLGYTKDIYGNELSRGNQILQLFPQDVILPAFSSGDNNAADVLIRVSKFLDDLMQKFYKKDKILNVSTKDDLVGKLVVGLAPHTSGGTVGRIIGFSNTQGLFCHPFFHAAMRRNCDGDEAAVMLLDDMLLNFERGLLPDSRGARYMDSPLVLSAILDMNGIDSEAYNMDIVATYPNEFYEATLRYAKPSEVVIPQAKGLLKDQLRTFFFTHDTDDINGGVNVSAYKTLETMQDKVFAEMALEEKIRAVDLVDIARIIIDKHFIKDIKGNLRRFGTEEFRCSKCSHRFTRAPLLGKCTRCGGNLVLTSSEGNVKKYLKISIDIAEKYAVPTYLKNELYLLKSEIDAIFGETINKQLSLAAF